MAASWKQVAATSATTAPRKVPFTQARKFFAVDASASTSGHIIQMEGRMAQRWDTHPQDRVSKWGSSCSEPKAVSSVAETSPFGNNPLGRPNRSYWTADQGGTYPAEILRCKSAEESIRQSDVWFLMTDGDVFENHVQDLAALANQVCVTNVPVCLVIFGRMRAAPDLVNISVGIPVYATATEALILFKDTHSTSIHVVAAKGAFSPLAKLPDRIDLSQWDNLASFDGDDALINECDKLGIEITCEADRQATSAVSLGPTWDSSTGVFVDIDVLLQEASVDPKDLDHLLQEEAFQQLALVCKTRRRLAELRLFLGRHKQEEMIVRLEDNHGAGQILRRMTANTTEEEKEVLAAQLRKAHAANRQSYQTQKDSPSEEAQTIRKLNRAIDQALALLAELEKAGYTADILSRKSNRARRAELLSQTDSETHLLGVDLSDDVEASRNTCSICCGEDEIMSVVLKKLESIEENTSDFFLNFPLVAAQAQQNANMISSQCICFQCATLVGNKSIFGEELSAILPAVSYTGYNKRYMNHQLTVAITAGLATGTAGIVQMFMSILDHTLENKQWCSPQSDIQQSDQEVSIRRQTLEWMLKDLLRTCITREKFSDETSSWVPYPLALLWALSDWEKRKLDAWIIQYPVKGFNQIMRWYEILQIPTSGTRTILEDIKTAKLLNVVVSTFMAQLLQSRNDRTWVHPFMQLIYREFNATNVPRDMGDQSVITSCHFWPKLEDVLGTREDGRQLLASITNSTRPASCRRIQLVMFWAIYIQKEHVTAKGFFYKLLLRKALAAAILDPGTTLPDERTLKSTLRSIFLKDGETTDPTHDGVPPFVTPFGPSVVSCGKVRCRKLFYDPDKPETLHPDLVRKQRAEHLNSVFQREARNDTGLPEPVNEPNRPKSLHYTLHMSIVKAWSAMPRSSKGTQTQDPIQASGAIELSKEDVINNQGRAVSDFVTRARERICSNSRRGNIYWHGMEGEIRELLPSFFEALRVASEKEGLDDRSGLSYVHDWTRNRLAHKIAYELSMTKTTPAALVEVSRTTSLRTR
ncbi:MAG: hypothetical protein L6R39_004176 [Caloplaca ligustica]|nr:MAG: hypothetical protein L6R39_004176 [Caloplaca ligustica]